MEKKIAKKKQPVDKVTNDLYSKSWLKGIIKNKLTFRYCGDKYNKSILNLYEGNSNFHLL